MPPAGQSACGRDPDLGRHRVRYETFPVRFIVQPIKIGLRRLPVSAETNSWAQFDARYGELPLRILLDPTDRIVLIAIDDEAFVRRQREKGEHVTARQCRDEGRLGVDALWIAQIGRRGGSWRLDAIFELPNMITAIIIVAEIGAITLPFDRGFVLDIDTPSLTWANGAFLPWQFAMKGEIVELDGDGSVMVNKPALLARAALDGIGLLYMVED